VIHDRIIALLEAHDIPFVLHEHAAVTTVADAHALAPHLTAFLVKTIAFDIGSANGIVLAAVASTAQVDYSCWRRRPRARGATCA
jgi:hypothetical protein